MLSWFPSCNATQCKAAMAMLRWDAALSPLSPRDSNIPAFDFECVLNDASIAASQYGPIRGQKPSRATRPYSPGGSTVEDEDEHGASSSRQPFRKPWSLDEDLSLIHI